MKDLLLALIGIAVVALLAFSSYQDYRRFHRPLLTTPYQAVTLRDGTVFYGRIDHLGTDYPVLRRAFTIRSATGSDRDAGGPTLVLLRDGPNGGDHLIFPAESIAWVEPVAPGSEIGRLIAKHGL